MPRLELDGPGWQAFDGTLEALAVLSRGQEYVSYLPPQGRPQVCVGASGHFESQYMRQAIARALGIHSWNWRSEPDAAAAHRTWRRCVRPHRVSLAG
jgi:hypothetical protein